MLDLVRNPKDRFSCDAAQQRVTMFLMTSSDSCIITYIDITQTCLYAICKKFIKAVKNDFFLIFAQNIDCGDMLRQF